MLNFVRENILQLKAYTSARHQNLDGILLDANENPFPKRRLGVNVNRYPDPNQKTLKSMISVQNKVSSDQLTIVSGSDEAFDIIFKTFINPGDEILIPVPTYGMYQVLADTYDAKAIQIKMDDKFQPNVKKIKSSLTKHSKAIFICHPSNPIGNLVESDRILELLKLGLPTVIDEAYIDFSIENSTLKYLVDYPNLIITRTLSKAVGLAGIRCAYMITSTELTRIFNAVKLPYNMNVLSLQIAIETLKLKSSVEINTIFSNKKILQEKLESLTYIEKILPSVTNFITFTTNIADELYEFMKSKNIILRRISSIDNAIRISIGSSEEMNCLYEQLDTFEKEVLIEQ